MDGPFLGAKAIFKPELAPEKKPRHSASRLEGPAGAAKEPT